MSKFIPEQNDDYFTVSDGEVLCFEFMWGDFDVKNVDSGNCFKTKKEAMEYLNGSYDRSGDTEDDAVAIKH